MAINYNPNAFGTTATLPGLPASGGSANPAPQSGSGVFGSVPGPTQLPNPFGNLASVYPNLSASDQGVSSTVLGNLMGTLSPDVLNQIQTSGAQNAFASGMPGSGFGQNAELAAAGQASQQEQATGASQYSGVIPGITSTQTLAPQTQIGIAESNANLAASPNPSEAGLFNLLTGIGGTAAGLGATGGFSNIGSWFGGGGSVDPMQTFDAGGGLSGGLMEDGDLIGVGGTNIF